VIGVIDVQLTLSEDFDSSTSANLHNLKEPLRLSEATAQTPWPKSQKPFEVIDNVVMYDLLIYKVLLYITVQVLAVVYNKAR